MYLVYLCMDGRTGCVERGKRTAKAFIHPCMHPSLTHTHTHPFAKQEGGLTVLREVKDGEVVSTTVRLTPEEVGALRVK